MRKSLELNNEWRVSSLKPVAFKMDANTLNFLLGLLNTQQEIGSVSNTTEV